MEDISIEYGKTTGECRKLAAVPSPDDLPIDVERPISYVSLQCIGIIASTFASWNVSRVFAPLGNEPSRRWYHMCDESSAARVTSLKSDAFINTYFTALYSSG